MSTNVAEYLMIEDNENDVEIALFDLAEYGIANTFHIARDAEDAIDYLFTKDGSLRINPPTAIFLDIHLPKICGLEFLHRIKSNEQTKSIPIVVLKSAMSPIEVDKCKELGVNNFVDKPLEYENFIAAIAAIGNIE